MGRGKQTTGAYRWAAFTHWLNLAFLAAAGVAGATIDPSIWLIAAPIEAGAMWVIPDLPPFRAAVDEEQDEVGLVREREYYMHQLWGLRPPARKSLGQRIAGIFTTQEEESLEERVLGRDDSSFRLYMEMRDIISKLRDLERVRGVSIPAHHIGRFEQVVNGYLRFVVAYRALARALHGIDANALQEELASIESQMETAAPPLRAVLGERKRMCKDRLARVPKLVAKKELFKTRADGIVYQLRNIHGQVLADPGMDVNAFLNDMVERHELLSDPLGDLEADQTIHEMLKQGEAR